jgi:hypothetical protein
MGASPSGLLIEPLFVSFDAIPTKMMQPVVCANRLNHATRLAVTPLAAINSIVFSGNHLSLSDVITSSLIQQLGCDCDGVMISVSRRNLCDLCVSAVNNSNGETHRRVAETARDHAEHLKTVLEHTAIGQFTVHNSGG